MKKQIALVLMAWILPGLAVASLQRGWTGNWYMGGSLGYATLYGDDHTNMMYGFGALAANTAVDVYRDYSDNGLLVGVLAGYQEIRNQWLVGAEFTADLQSIDKNHPFAFSDAQELVGWNADVRYQRRNMLGLVGRVGYAVTPFMMPYFRLGVEFSNDKMTTSYFGNPAVYPYDVVISQAHWLHRFLIGVGAEVPLPHTCGATMRLEYNFHSKGRTIEEYGSLVDGIFSPQFYNEMQPEMQSGRISLVWNFF